MATFYLQHGRAGDSMMTEAVESTESPLWWQERGLSFTASGYGARIPTRHLVRYNGRWRRVYLCVYSNSGTCYIGKSLTAGIVVTD